MTTDNTRRFPLAQKLGRLQDIIGEAKGAYLNDRAFDRAERLLPLLDEAFQIVVEIRSRRYRT